MMTAEKKAKNFSLLLLPSSLIPSADNNAIYTCERPFSYLFVVALLQLQSTEACTYRYSKIVVL